MISTKTIQLLGVICLMASCAPTPVSIHLTNNLSIVRQNETVEVLIADLPEPLSYKIDKIGVYDH